MHSAKSDLVSNIIGIFEVSRFGLKCLKLLSFIYSCFNYYLPALNILSRRISIF